MIIKIFIGVLAVIVCLLCFFGLVFDRGIAIKIGVIALTVLWFVFLITGIICVFYEVI